MKQFFSKQFFSVIFLFLTLLSITDSKAQATIGIYESYAILNINGAGNTFYDLTAATTNPDFSGANLGTFNQTQTLVLAGGQNKTFKCNGGNVTGGNTYYRVYLVGGSAPAYTTLTQNMGFVSNDAGGCGGNQTWQATTGTANVLQGLGVGTYNFQVFTEATGSPANVSTAAFTATFTVNSVFGDSFNRASLTPGGSPSMTYATSTVANVTATTTGNFLTIGSGTTAPANGVAYVTGATSTYASPYSSTLNANTGLVTWTTNFRWNRASSNNPAVPASGAYGSAIVLAGSSATLTGGNGYAIVYGSAGSPDPIRLVAYTGGLIGGTLTDICSSGANDIANTNNYASIRVTYDPATNNWSLFVRDDGTTAWADPISGVTAQKGTTTANSTYTGTSLTTFGFVHTFATAASTGSQFDNFNVQVAPSTTPSLNASTAVVTSSTSATLGATVTSNGGSTLTARGTVYKTTSGVTATDNALAEGGTTVATFTHSRTGLSPQTQYFYRGYATNGVPNTGLSAESSFRTWSEAPTAQPATFTTTAGNSQLVANWGTATFPVSGATQAGYAIIYSTGTPTFTAANGSAPTAGVGTLVNVTTALSLTPATTTTITGLANNSLYNLLIIPYTWDGTNATTYNYLTSGAKTTTGTPVNQTYTWNGGTSGAWSTPANWLPATSIAGPSTGDSVIFNTGGNIAVSSVPGVTLNSIALATTGTNVSLTPATATSATITLSTVGTALSVPVGTTLNVNGNTTGNLFLAYSGAGNTVTIAGTLNLQLGSGTSGSGNYTATNSTTTVSGLMTVNTSSASISSTTSNLIFANGGKFQLLGTNTVAVPTATWQTGSTLQLSQSGSSTLNMSGLSGQTFANLTIDATSTGTFNFNNSATLVSFTVSGNYTQSGTPLIELGASTATTNISVGGNFQKTAGTLSTTTSTTNATITLTNTSGTATFQCNSSGWVNFTVAASAIYVMNGGVAVANSPSIVTVTGTLDCGANIVSGTASSTFVLGTAGTLRMGSPNGITTTGATGNIQVGGARTFPTTANYVYNGTASQVTGNGLPATVNTLTISNTGTAPDNVVTLSAITAITATTNSLRLTAGRLDLNNKQLTLASGGTVASTGGDFTATAGPLFFLGTGTTTGTINFPTVVTAGGVTFNTGANIVTSLQINNGGFVPTPPTYGSSSTLIYNSGTSYGRYNEWSATSGAGYPNNIQVNTGSALDAVNSVNSYKKAAGNLIVNSGATFNMYGLTSGTSGVGIEFLGDITNDGTINMNSNGTSTRLKARNLTNGNSNSTANFNLGLNVGGDLELTGNYTDNANFTANSRAVFFTGTGVQTVSGTATAPFNIDYIVSNKTAGSIQLGVNLLTAGPNGGNAITLTNATDILDLNGRTLTLGSSGVASTISGNGLFKGSATSSMTLNGTGAFGTVRFDQTDDSSRTLNNLILNRTSSGGMVLGNDAIVAGTLTLSAGTVNLGASNLTIGASGAILVSSPDATKMIIASGAGQLRKTFTSTGSFTYPIGDNTATAEYTPATLNFTAGTLNGYAGVNVTDAKHPNNTSTTDFLTRYFTVTTSGLTAPTCAASFSYLDNDINGTEANLKEGRYAASAWNCLGDINAAANTIDATVSAFGDFNAGENAVMGCCINPTSGGTIANITTDVCPNGTPAAFTNSADASGHTGILEYKWQASTTGAGSGFSDISLATAATYAPGALTATTWFKRMAKVTCQTSWTGAAESNVVQISVRTLPSVSISSNNGPVCYDTTASFTLNGTADAVVSYNINGTSGSATLTGGTATVSVLNATSPQLLTLESITDGTCPATLSATSTVSIRTQPTASITGNNNPVCSGGTATFTLNGTDGAVVTYDINGSTDTVTLTGGTATVTVTNATVNQLLSLTSVNDSSCTASLSGSSLVNVNANSSYYADADGDGFGYGAALLSCTGQPANTVTNNLDSDDNLLTYVDNDTDGVGGTAYAPSGPTTNTDCDDNESEFYQLANMYNDADADGFALGTATTPICYGAVVPPGYSLTSEGEDCDDTNPAINQSQTFYIDADNDGYDAGSELVCAGASVPTGYSLTTSGTDCDDTNASIYISATLYTDVDGDTYTVGNGSTVCYGATLPAGTRLTQSSTNDCDDTNAAIYRSATLYTDVDGDTYTVGTGSTVCYGATLPAGTTLTASGTGDCDDTDDAIYRSATLYTDVDGDTYTVGTGSTVCYGATLPAGKTLTASGTEDCDDTNALIFTSANLYTDLDGDGYDNGAIIGICIGATSPLGTSATTLGYDCDDTNAAIYQFATFYVDADGDGYDLGTASVCSGVSAPTGYAAASNGTDCDDTDNTKYQSNLLYTDFDGDGYTVGAATLVCYGATLPSGKSLTSAGTDCDDTNAAIYRSATLFIDVDGDTYTVGTGSTVCYGATLPAGTSLTQSASDDCDDTNAAIYRSATLFTDVDGDTYTVGTGSTVCYGATLPAGTSLTQSGTDDCDDANVAIYRSATLYTDVDGDAYTVGTGSTVCYGATLPAGTTLTQSVTNDCDDANPAVYQSATLYADNDNDGYGAGSSTLVCASVDCSSSQIAVTLRVDMTGQTVTSGGVHVAGNFATLGSTTITNDWTPAAAGSQLRSIGSNIYEVTVLFPATAVGSQLQFKFLRNNIWYDGNQYSEQTISNTCGNSGNRVLILGGKYLSFAAAYEQCPSALQGYACNNTDCDDSNAAIYQTGTVYTDVDGDGYTVGPPATVCFGSNGSSNTSLGEDCDDLNLALHAAYEMYTDNDNDGFGASSSTSVCAPVDCSSNTIAVTFRLDLTGQTIGSGGVHVAGNFATRGSTTITSDWDPAAAGSQLRSIGNNIYELTVLFPATSAGSSLEYKFLRNNIWSDGNQYSEQTIPNTCGNSGNRLLTLPSKFLVFTAAYEQCPSALQQYVCNNTDCDDTNATKNTSFPFYADFDGDSYGAGSLISVCAVNATTPPVGYSLNNTDCDDNYSAIYRSATLYTDADGDGYDVGSATVCYGSTLPAGTSLTTLGTDCDDTNAAIYQFATFYLDADGDGYTNGTASVCSGVGAPSGYSGTSSGTDCNDNNASIYRSATLYTDLDGDTYTVGTGTVTCYGATLPAGTTLTQSSTNDCDDINAAIYRSDILYADADGDTYTVGSGTVTCYGSTLPAGTTLTQSSTNDCDDTDPLIYRSATLYTDVDGDTYTIGTGSTVCYGATLPAGTTLTQSGSDDCDDSNATTYRTDFLDLDADNDGYSGGVSTTLVCYGATAPTGYVLVSLGTDCDDTNAALTNNCVTGKVVNLTMFIEGYYLGGGTMNSVRLNQDYVSPADEVEVVTVNLHDATTYELVETATGTLKTDGTLSVTFTTAAAGLYYVAVKGVNMIETWSATPQTVGSSPLSYDFSSSASQAYEDNMREMEPGVFAFYQGDINQDGAMDNSDFDQLFPDIDNSNFGVQATDLNGDGAVDNSDLDNIFSNVDNSIYAHRPF